jgi:subtilisin
MADSSGRAISTTSQNAVDTQLNLRLSRDKAFLVARRDSLLPAGSDFAPLNLDVFIDKLHKDPQTYVERVIAPSGLATLADTPATLQCIVVVRMSDEKAQELNQHPQLLVEEDAPLRPAPVSAPTLVKPLNPLSFVPFGGSSTWEFQVSGPDGSPAVGATVFLYGASVPAQGRTDDNGQVSLSLLNESDDTIRAIYINPQTTYWNLWINNPKLTSTNFNTIRLRPLATTFVGFPQSQIVGWGQRTMRLDQLDPTMTGAGVKVAVIDSGAAVTHPDLAQINIGRDFTVNPADDSSWTNDSMAHGSHCSGMIAGRNDAVGIRGFAPDANIHALRIFPGGRFSNLLDALDYCIEQQIDVVNMSVGTEGATSEAVLLKLTQAKQAGVACIVAAGNSGGNVLFPGLSPDVLTIAAVGKLGEFPADSFHALQVPSGGPTDHGYFSPPFSCHGPEVDLCAPGVAIVSSVPSAGYAAWDGTSMATPHVTGLAALVVAHHPDFTNGFRTRNGSRVERLFQILKNSATPLALGDPDRTGAGLPDAVQALTAQVPARPTLGPLGTTASIATVLLDQLHKEFIAVGLAPS